MTKLDTAVLFLVFNRPNTTQKVFEQIRQAKPPRLFVAADGPRDNKPGEAEKCAQTRKIATSIDWDCEMKTLFRSENLGCRNAVSGAIDWFFEHEAMGIILEDDCVPNQSFFPFCQELLERYQNVKEVMTISGNNFQPKQRTENSYYFSKYMHCWGWASWRRAWKHYDQNMNAWELAKANDTLSKIFTRKEARYWARIFDRVYKDEIDSWAYIWTLSIWVNNGINILPEKNLVSNIGFGEEATHTIGKSSDAGVKPSGSITFPLHHPKDIKQNIKADRYTQKYHYQKPLYLRVLNKFKKQLLK